jgi:hypothetical protein
MAEKLLVAFLDYPLLIAGIGFIDFSNYFRVSNKMDKNIFSNRFFVFNKQSHLMIQKMTLTERINLIGCQLGL